MSGSSAVAVAYYFAELVRDNSQSLFLIVFGALLFAVGSVLRRKLSRSEQTEGSHVAMWGSDSMYETGYLGGVDRVASSQQPARVM